jgi:hypothetical protein
MRTPLTADDPRHGTTRGYHAGCHEPCCRDAMTRREKYLKLLRHRGMQTSVPACGAQRRIQALMWAGWSATDISTAAGWSHRNAVHRILKGQKGKPTVWLERKTHDAVAAVFRDLWAKTPTSKYAGRTATAARAKGYLSALAWDDIDDPDEQPNVGTLSPTRVADGGYARQDRDDIDEVVVTRILGGDWRLRSTVAEKCAVVARWTGTLGELERLTGWKPERYVTREDDVA